MNEKRKRFLMRGWQFPLLGAFVLSLIFGDVTVAQSQQNPSDMSAAIRKAIVTLPNYGVFDDLSFDLQESTVILRGFASRPSLKESVSQAVKKIQGVEKVINQIEVLPEALRHAFRVATSGKMGPVMIDIPRDLLPGAEIELDLLSPDAYRPGQTRSRGDQGLIDKAAAVLSAAQRPVILAGGGVQWSNAGDEVCRMAELTGAAIVTSYGRADAVPNDHPSYLGHLGRLGSLEGIEAMRQADTILAVGTRLSQSTTFYDNRFIPADAKIIQIEIDPQEIGRNYPVTVGI
ncbi:MAG: BON domain-containing protein, partial [Acidobacteria bacterium]|nr:BON domain-containing protein [Acidobacteriota bacterium]